MKTMKLLIISGGSIDEDFLGAWLAGKNFDGLIAADAGLAVCDRLGIMPTEILGDFDSLGQIELLEKYEKMGIPVHRYPAKKDKTDTHLALELALEKKPDEVTLFGASGTRLDHTLANIGLLTIMADAGVSAKMIDRHNCLEMLSGRQRRVYRKTEQKSYLSVMACSPLVTGLGMKGFAYPLSDVSLPAFDSLGISNEITEDEAVLTMESGYLLVARTSDEGWKMEKEK